MGRLGSKLWQGEGGRVAFYCPGCKCSHAISVGEGSGPRWGFNGDGDAPTFTPSVLVRSGHHMPGREPDAACWCTYYEQHPDEDVGDRFECELCHSFVTAGRIQFLTDSTHELAGQTVDLPDHP